MDTWTYIGNQIMAARQERGWSTEELARRLRTSGATMSRWQSAKQRIAFDDLEQLAKVLGKPVQFFLPGWYVDPEAVAPEIAHLTNRLSEIPAGEFRQRVADVLQRQVEILLELIPDWYVDPSAISPEIGHLIQRLNQIPTGETRDKLIENITGQVEILLQSFVEKK
ncbi:MAG TPA: helix-turn-helix transcriptional regulator [Anaerolineae bacterium]|nr:helix-turn-helix transcriptional regulator [Anaerolineae bacterium]